MDSSHLLLSAALSVLAGALYAYVGWRLKDRQVSPAATPAHRSFVFWWVALAAISMTSALMQVLYVADALPVWLYRVFTQVALLVVVAALAALLYFLVFVYTGSPRAWILPVVYGGLAFILIEAIVFMAPEPTAITDDGWRLEAEPESELPTGIAIAFTLLVLGPQVGAAIGYALLYRRASDATSRYRIALVSTSIIVWFSSSIVAGLSDAGETRSWQMASQLLSVAAASTILVAYLPPAAWKARWGLRSIADEHGAS